MAKTERPKSILLKDIPDDVWQKIRKVKLDIMQKNASRGNVSHREAIYKLIKNNCAEI